MADLRTPRAFAVATALTAFAGVLWFARLEKAEGDPSLVRRSSATESVGSSRTEGLGPLRRAEDESARSAVVASQQAAVDSATSRSVMSTSHGEALLPVSLVDAFGAPMTTGAIAVQQLEPRGGLQEFEWTSEDRVLRLAPGTVRLRGYGSLFADPERDTCYDAGEASPFREVELIEGINPELGLVLRPRGGIHVTAQLEGVGGALIRVAPIERGSRITEDLLLSGDSGDDDGFGFSRNNIGDRTQTFMDLDAGLYAVAATDYAGLVYGHDVVEVEDQIVELELILGGLDDRRLDLSVTGPDGSALDEPEQLIVSMERSRGGKKDVFRGVSSRQGEGAYEVWFPAEQARYFDPSDLTSEYTLVVYHADHGRVRTDLDPGQVSAAIVFDAPISLDVRLIGFEATDENPIVVRAVSLEQITDGAPSLLAQFSNTVVLGAASKGSGRLEGLLPGQYRVTINFFELADGQLQSIVAGWKLVDLLTEGTLVEFEVPSTHELSVIVPGASGGTGIRLSRARIDPVLLWDHEPLTRTLDSGGRARFLVLPDGEYLLEVDGREEPVRVTVPCAEVSVR